MFDILYHLSSPTTLPRGMETQEDMRLLGGPKLHRERSDISTWDWAESGWDEEVCCFFELRLPPVLCSALLTCSVCKVFSLFAARTYGPSRVRGGFAALWVSLGPDPCVQGGLASQSSARGTNYSLAWKRRSALGPVLPPLHILSFQEPAGRLMPLFKPRRSKSPLCLETVGGLLQARLVERRHSRKHIVLIALKP